MLKRIPGARALRFALAILAATASLGAAAQIGSGPQQVLWVNLAAPYSLRVGEVFTPPRVAMQTNDASPGFVVTVDVLGGCGTFAGGQTSAQVTLQADPPFSFVIANTPAFTATRPGACTMRAYYPNQRGQIQAWRFDVFDPNTVRIEPLHALVTVPTRNSTSRLAARVVDAGGFYAEGYRVRYEMNPECRDLQLFDSSYEATTGATGVASRGYISTGSRTGTCTFKATLLQKSQSIDLPLRIYDEKKVQVAAIPDPLLTFVREGFAVDAIVTDEDGTPLPLVPLGIRVGGTPAGAGAGLFFGENTSRETDASGRFHYTGASANDKPGHYDLILSVGYNEFRVPVIQSVRGQPAPQPVRLTRSLTDMWWGGASQSGWGMSVVQHRDVLFQVLYVYDFSGNPVWWVMPGGRWNSTGTTYSSTGYVTQGAPYFAYDAAQLKLLELGAPVNLAFADDDNLLLDYAGLGLAKPMRRQLFGTGSATLTGVSDMWWGGSAQNGWGIAIIQQGANLFCVWFTYDAAGKAIWYVMPSATLGAGDAAEGRIYRTKSAYEWIDTRYSPQIITTNDVGSFRLRFTSPQTATFDYTVEGRTGTLSLTRQGF